MLEQARAILWAQWRCLRNFYARGNRGGLVAFSVLTALWYGAVASASAGVAYLIARIDDPAQLESWLAPGLFLAFLYWQVVPLMLAATGAAVDLKRVIVYPIPTRQLFAVEVLLRMTTGIEVLIGLLGCAAGLLLNSGVPAWAPVVLAPFAAFNLFLSAGIRALLGRLLARRYVREVVVLALALAAAFPGLLLQTEAFGGLREYAPVARRLSPLMPWGAAAAFISGANQMAAAGVLLAWTLAAFAFGRSQFQRSLSFDADAARAPAGGRASVGWVERLYRLPSALLSDPLGAMVEKEIRFLSRAPRFRLVFTMGFTFGLLIWLPLAYGREAPGDWSMASNYLTFVCVYALLLLGDVCFWNSFGFDRGAAQLYYLVPLHFKTVILAKNIAAVLFILLEIAVIVMLCSVIGLTVTGPKALEAFSVAIVLTLFLLAAGNLVSIYHPRAVDPSQSWRSSASRFHALLLALYPLLGAPIGLAYLARYAFASDLAFYAVLLFDLALAAVAYSIAIDSVATRAEADRERIAARLSESAGPVSA
jgi:ABC-2 type transport system permease protein